MAQDEITTLSWKILDIAFVFWPDDLLGVPKGVSMGYGMKWEVVRKQCEEVFGNIFMIESIYIRREFVLGNL